tara:strand:+ start:404 stop:763 length:360 start_codon:yes stop_codon:yes gene_type:complete
MKNIYLLLICFTLAGCETADPIVGKWKTSNGMFIILSEDGKGKEISETETPLTWEKREEHGYVFYYHYEDYISPVAPTLENGVLSFHREDYIYLLKRVEPDGTGQPMSPAQKSENHSNH